MKKRLVSLLLALLLVGGALHGFGVVCSACVVGHVVGELLPEPHQPVRECRMVVAGNTDGNVQRA